MAVGLTLCFGCCGLLVVVDVGTCLDLVFRFAAVLFSCPLVVLIRPILSETQA